MQKLQEVFDRIRATKREQKELNNMYKDALESSHEYKDVLEKLRGFKLRKQQIEEQVKAELGSDFSKLEALKKEAQLDKDLLSDIAVNHLVEGREIKIADEDQNEYEPIFSVKFKKTNVIRQQPT